MNKLHLKKHKNIFFLKDTLTQKFIKVEQRDPFNVDIAESDAYYGLFETVHYSENDLSLNEMLESFFLNGFLLDKVDKIYEQITISDFYSNENTFVKETYYISFITILSVDEIKDKETREKIVQPKIRLHTYQEILDSSDSKTLEALLSQYKSMFEIPG